MVRACQCAAKTRRDDLGLSGTRGLLTPPPLWRCIDGTPPTIGVGGRAGKWHSMGTVATGDGGDKQGDETSNRNCRIKKQVRG